MPPKMWEARENLWSFPHVFPYIYIYNHNNHTYIYIYHHIAIYNHCFTFWYGTCSIPRNMFLVLTSVSNAVTLSTFQKTCQESVPNVVDVSWMFLGPPCIVLHLTMDPKHDVLTVQYKFKSSDIDAVAYVDRPINKPKQSQTSLYD